MTETVYKLMTDTDRTRVGWPNETHWPEGAEHTAPGGGELCTSAYIHAYRTPLQAVFMDIFHGQYLPYAKLRECDADVELDDGTKLGCTRVRAGREMPIPSLSAEQRVEIAIRAAMEVCRAKGFVKWATGWLSGRDRSSRAADAAYRATYAVACAAATAGDIAAYRAACAANTAVDIGYAAYRAACAVAETAVAAHAAGKKLNLCALIEQVVGREGET